MLKVPPNCEITPKEHFRTISAQSRVQSEKLHVPSRRENYNSKISVQLGSTHDVKVIPTATQQSSYKIVTRYDCTHKNILNVFEVSKSKVYSDNEPTTI